MLPFPVQGQETLRRRVILVVGASFIELQCAAKPPEPAATPFASTDTHPTRAEAPRSPPTVATPAAPATALDRGPCPDGMQHVEKNFCPKLERRCLKQERDKINNITICHRFEPGTPACQAPRIALDFCIDVFEYPNQKGARPPVMVDWYEAMGFCAAQDKRLCYESEWTAACEGPDEHPFPYGLERSAEKCNIDNTWITPELSLVYSSDPNKSAAELKRIDQSVPSGHKPGCVSAYGVHDLTGNLDEWTLADHDRPKEKAVFAALKGGAWGHVRNACRPVTTSHEPEFRYYFVSFRCCRDAPGMQPGEAR